MAPKKKYSEEQMQKAIDCVNGGEKISYAAQKYGVPRITLYNKMTGKSPLVCSMGPSTYLTKEEEYILETWILQMNDSHIPVTKDDLLDSVQRIITEKGMQTPFVHNRPGKKWYSLFLKRHPLISERTAQNLTAARDNVTEEGIRNWFIEIETYLRGKNLLTVLEHPERVFNTDESAFYLAPKAGKVLAKKGEKHVYSSSGDDKENLTVLVTGNAAGQLAPTMVVFNYERIPSAVSNNFPSDWAIGRSDSGWMCGSTFYEYIANIFNPWLDENNIERPVLFFLDGHKSHLTLHLSDFCVANGIEIIALNPNSTHIMQPMDLAVFRPLKSSWRKAVNNWKLQNLGQTLKKEHFAPVLKSAFETLTRDSIKNGFRAGGLCPFGPDYIDMTKIKHSQRQESEHDVAKKDFFSYLESEISAVFTSQKLHEFRQLYFTGRDNLEVPEQDLSLYIIWAKNHEASSTLQLSEVHTQSAVTTRDFTPQIETTVQNEIHPDVHDMTINPVPSQPKMATHNEPRPGTSKDLSDLTVDPVNSELTTVIDPKSRISQDPRSETMISYSETIARNESTPDTFSNTSGMTAGPILQYTTTARNDSTSKSSRGTSDVTLGLATYSEETSPKSLNAGTFGDPLHALAGSVSLNQPEMTDRNDGCDIIVVSLTSNSNTQMPQNENILDRSALDSSDKTINSIMHYEMIPPNDPKLDAFGDSIVIASPVTYSESTARKDSKPGISRDPLNVTAGPPTRTEVITRNEPKPSTPTNFSDITAGPVTSEKTPKKTVIKSGIVIPSPFKRNLFWPDEIESNKKKRKLKEKIPFAIGSPAWRTYHRNKDNEKQRKLLEKAKRAEERKEKKKKIEELKNKTIKKKFKKQVKLPISSDDTDTEVKYAESDDSLYEEEFNESLNETPIPYSSGSEADNEPLSRLFVKLNTTKTKKSKLQAISEGCYVIIKYEGEYFPGIVENVDGNHYKVSTMTFSTGNTYRWPNKPDSIWYEETDIVEKIQKPVLINKRGYYEVKEMKKFHAFTI